MKLEIVQHHKRLATVERPEFVANHPHVTDSDLDATKATVAKLRTEGKLLTGYYDVTLYDGIRVIDSSTEIA